MRPHQFVALGLFVGGMASSGPLRRAEILDFPSSTPASQLPGSEAISPPVYTSMLDLFRTDGSADLTIHPKGYHPYRLKSVADRSATSSSEPCLASRYSPTWWLPPQVEARRATHFRIVATAACEVGIPLKLLDALVAQESGYNPWAVSKAGAAGIVQIMPGTARLLGLGAPFDPVANMRAGARYLRQQLDRFGRIDLALAAYNAGPGRQALQDGYIPAIPETQHYVRTILTNWGRLIELDQANTREPDRGELAMIAVRASGYREVELIRYDGLNASNPM